MSANRSIVVTAGVVAVAGAVAAVSTTGAAPDRARPGLPKGSEPVQLDPADFTTRIDNPYWPMKPGSRWTYRAIDSDGARERVVVTVTNRTKKVAIGITARVIRDVVTERGQPVEVTDDWYAQDRGGNVWYLGEATTSYRNGKPESTEGSFEVGVDGAQAGVIMPAHPRPGMRYRQEHYAGHAEDSGVVFSLREQAEVPFGHFGPGRVLMTKDLNRLDRRSLEYKFYAKGVGPVLSIDVSGGSDREELVRYRPG
jgi:hypothetical protein